MEEMTRRGLAGLTVLGAAGLAATQARAATGADSLDALAKAKGFVGFGSCMGGGAEDFASSFNDSGVRAIHQRDCGILVCENETKWVALRPNPKEYSFYLADRMMEWAEANNMAMRGHTLLWHNQAPKWLFQDDSGKPLPREEALANSLPIDTRRFSRCFLRRPCS